MAKEVIVPAGVFDSRKTFGYSQAYKIGKTIYVAGQGPWDEAGKVVGKGDMAVQARQTYENIKRTLAAAGAAMNDIVKINIYLINLDQFRQAGGVIKEYMGGNLAPATAVQVSRLWFPDQLLEIDVVASLE